MKKLVLSLCLLVAASASASADGVMMPNAPPFTPDATSTVENFYFIDSTYPNPDYDPFCVCPAPETVEGLMVASTITQAAAPGECDPPESFILYAYIGPVPVDTTTCPVGDGSSQTTPSTPGLAPGDYPSRKMFMMQYRPDYLIYEVWPGLDLLAPMGDLWFN